MVFHTYHTIKKTFYYNFFPTKAEEEDLEARRIPVGPINGRVLVEMRDIFPPPMLDPSYPWMINKTLTHIEISSGKFVISHNDMLEHVIRYWSLNMANYIGIGQKVGVALWDITDEKNPKKYQGNEVYLQLMANDDCILACMDLIKDRELKVDDKVSILWDAKETSFQFKLV